MRKELELIEGIRNTLENYDGLFITEEELQIIQGSEFVESCEYAGLKDGHVGKETYHVTLTDDSSIKSLYIEE